MGILDGGMAKYRFALLPIESKRLSYISDEDILYHHIWFSADGLGLDHIDKTGRAGQQLVASAQSLSKADLYCIRSAYTLVALEPCSYKTKSHPGASKKTVKEL